MPARMRMSALRLAWALLAVVRRGVLSTRVSTSSGKAQSEASSEEFPSVRSYIGDADMICGGPTIWSMLTASSSITSVQNIKWGQMEALKTAHISEQGAKVKELEIELESLAGLIAERQLKELPQYTTLEQHKELIEAALGSESFGGPDIAKGSDCGNPRSRPRAPRGAYRLGQQAFESKAMQLFQTKKFRLDGDGFLEVCHSLLPSENERSYCGPLCQSFKDTAQKISYEEVGEMARSVSDLIKLRQKKLGELVKAKLSLASCSKAWDGLSVFREHIESMKGAMTERFREVRKAEGALEDAQWRVEDVEVLLQQHEQVNMSEALEAVTAAVEDKEQARAALQGLVNKQAALRLRIEGLKKPLQEGRSHFEALKNADKTVVDIKTAISAIMVKMDLFSTSAVVKPLQSIGFESTLDLDVLFPKNPAEISSADMLKSSVQKLHEYCTDTAMPAFQVISDLVDLSPLCELGDRDDTTSELNEAVVDRMESIKAQILWVKSWLNPYRHDKTMTKEKAAQLVERGEPEGFQEIVSVYHETEFFEYLRKWRYGGVFLKLLAQLKNSVQTLDFSVQEMEKGLQAVKAELDSVLSAQEKAKEELDQAIELLQEADESKKVMEEYSAELQSRAEKLATEISHLDEDLERAKERYAAAKQKLLQAHEQGTAALPHSAESLAELQAQRGEARQLVSLIERSLARRERAHREAGVPLAGPQ